MVNSGSGIFNGMMNIGFLRTVSDEKVRSIEVHLLDFEGDLYEQNMKVKLIARIRDEKRFASVGRGT